LVPIEELQPPGEDDPDPGPKTELPLVAIFLLFTAFPALPAPLVSFLSETILERSAAKSAIVSENNKIKPS
jgi:hypothetical protein